MMTDRPILFSAPMVRAILAGTKAQMRRIVKNCWGVINGAPWTAAPAGPACTGVADIRCPYGVPGDRLWVRETWMDLHGTGVERRNKDGDLQRYVYAADTPPGSYGDECRKDFGLKWRPSIHMPRAVSRMTLEIAGVRVERLQDISEADAEAEGSREWAAEQDTPARDIPAGETRLIYRQLWESINGPGSWDANPWVWVVEFKRAAALAG